MCASPCPSPAPTAVPFSRRRVRHQSSRPRCMRMSSKAVGSSTGGFEQPTRRVGRVGAIRLAAAAAAARGGGRGVGDCMLAPPQPPPSHVLTSPHPSVGCPPLTVERGEGKEERGKEGEKRERESAIVNFLSGGVATPANIDFVTAVPRDPGHRCNVSMSPHGKDAVEHPTGQV